METHVWRLIQQWRDRRDFPVSQASLAKAIGVRPTALSQWKLGQARPTPEHLRAIATLTGISYGDLLEALLRDMGYLRTESLQDAAANATQPVSVPALDGELHLEGGVMPPERTRGQSPER